jgi:uncharacterized membrane protein
LLACLAGSSINIPLHRIRNEQVVTDQVVPVFGFRWRVPIVTPRETVVTVNVGAVIPCLVALYLWAKTAYPLHAVLGIAIVAAISKRLARPVPGLGIALPAFIPPSCRRSWRGCWHRHKRPWWPTSPARSGC